jgi:hypothetical protein
MEERQIINIARPNPTSTTTTKAHCTPFTLPSNGVLTLGVSDVLTLTSDAVFRPECTGSSDVLLTGLSYPSLRDPFYASTLPELYALAATTVIAYMLVIMLLITPRTFLHEGAVVLGRRGFTNGPSGSDAGIGIGGRPWLQKVAALTVAISLTIATADTFKVAEEQYETGYMDAQTLQILVENGMELKIIRVISDTFLWLAQAQTLIRLFPRQREKIIIKWTAFALITLDVLFSILNQFVYNGNSRPHTFVDAVPALAYVFQLALSFLYGAWVIYYAITKKRFAFFHPQMRNICLVALLSLVSVFVPVVFFVLDISKPTLAGWGDYVRWVGAAAASVVVWEWVERIEALEREDKKDGVLGREVFDGDEMLEVNTLSDTSWKSRLRYHKDDRDGDGKGGGEGGTTTGSNGISWPGVASLASRYRPRTTHDIEIGRSGRSKQTQQTAKRVPRSRPPLWPIRPPPAATPISRTDTASAESTVYAIRYHPVSEPTPIHEHEPAREISRGSSTEINIAPNDNDNGSEISEKSVVIEQMGEGHEADSDHRRPNAWQALAKVNPFRKGPQGPPPEVSAHTAKIPEPANGHPPPNKWDVRARLEDFAATQAEKLREKKRSGVSIGTLPVTVIPAPPRRRNLATTYEELENVEMGEGMHSDSNTFVGSPDSSLERRQTQDQESPRVPRPQRLSDPYTPDDLNGHSMYQRGAISFLTAVQQERDGDAAISPVSPPLEEAVERFLPASSQGSPYQSRTPSSPRRDGLSVMSIPAPARHLKSEEISE